MADKEQDGPRGHGETVLVVEDVAILRRVVVRQMTELGYRALEAGDANAALTILAEQPIDILFTDVMLGSRGDGFGLAKEARNRAPNLRVLFTSGFPDSRVQSAAGNRPVQILGKPFRRSDLARALRTALDTPV